MTKWHFAEVSAWYLASFCAWIGDKKGRQAFNCVPAAVIPITAIVSSRKFSPKQK